MSNLQAVIVISVGITTLIGSFVALIKWMVKHYLYELRPNGGGSVKDQVNRLENRVDDIYRILCERNDK